MKYMPMYPSVSFSLKYVTIHPIQKTIKHHLERWLPNGKAPEKPKFSFQIIDKYQNTNMEHTLDYR